MAQWEELGPEYPGVDVKVDRVGGRLRIIGIRVEDRDGVTHDRIRSVPVARLEAMMNEQPDLVLRQLFPGAGWPPPTTRQLRIPDEYFENPEGRGYAPELYVKVATLYGRCVAGGVNPAPTIAEANDVSESQVHRWIREARRRGVLAPARGPGAQG